MPEILNEETPIVPEKKPMSAVLSAIVGIAIGSLAGYTGDNAIDEATMQSKIETSRHEIIAEEIIPERIIESTVDSVTTVDTLDAYVQPIIKSYTVNEITGIADTFIISVTKKNTDSLLMYIVATPPAGRTPVIKAQFLDMN